ncbi:hypothetical protein [Saccharopolyspora spinosa]|nr:hypothetical protein [Saccharopolyspora spinosa]
MPNTAGSASAPTSLIGATTLIGPRRIARYRKATPIPAPKPERAPHHMADAVGDPAGVKRSSKLTSVPPTCA